MKDLIHDGTEQPDGTIDYVQVKEWNKRLGKHKFDIKVYAEFLKYTTIGTPEDGFTKLGEEELTAHLTYSQLETIFEETEDFRQGNIGIIKSSSFSQEFNEQLVGIAITQKGALLKKILCQNDVDTSYHYKYGGEDVHLFRFIVKFGNAKRGVWIYPYYSWIYAWKLDPNDAYQTSPLIDGVERANISQLRINGNPLLYWMQYFDSKLLGDYSNHSGVNSDGDSSITICNDLGNYPEIDIIDLMCDNLGIEEDKRDIILNTYVSASGDYSTLDYERYDDIPLITAYSNELPAPAVWKKQVNSGGDIDYYKIWITPFVVGIGVMDSTANLASGIYITKVNDTTSIKTHTVLVNPAGLDGYHIRRMWFDTSNTFYILLEHYSTAVWRVAKIVLSGESTATWTYSGTLTMPADAHGEAWQRYFLQSDLDFHDNRLYASLIVQYNAHADNDLQVGYWPLVFTSNGAGTSTWVQETNALITGDVYTWAFYWSDEYHYTGGFRCLRDSGGNHAIGFFVHNNGWINRDLFFYIYDDRTDVLAQFLYTSYGALSGFAIGCVAVESIGSGKNDLGKGTVGGFTKDGTAYFILTSLPIDGANSKLAYWFTYNIGDTGTGAFQQVKDAYNFNLYRSLNSHGSADIDYCVGWCSLDDIKIMQDIVEGDNRYTVVYPTLFYLSGGVPSITKGRAAYCCGNESNSPHVAGSYDDVWPCISPPSITGMIDEVSLIDNTTIKDKPFIFNKYWNWDVAGAFYSSGTYLEVYSNTWWPNFQKDFISNGGTYADEFQGIISANGSIAYFSHDYTLIKPRYSGTDSDITDNDKQLLNSINFNAFNYKVLPKYFSVELDYGGENTIIYGSTSLLNRLQIQSDYILPNRAPTIVEQLYDVYNKDRLEFEVDIKFKHYLQPCDIVKLYPPISPGGIGFYDNVKTIYQYNAGQIELSDPLEPILCMITRNEIDNEICKLTMVSLGTNPGNIV